MKETLKARKRHGADSLDLTVPAKAVRNLEINDGDVFELEVEQEEGTVKLIYKRVYQASEE